MIVTGVDGCKAGWVAITQDLEDDGICSDVYFKFSDLVSNLKDSSVIAVDIPIGLTDSGPRTCDQLARSLLGKRHSTIFPAPIRPALDATSRLAASEITRAVDGRGVGVQAWNIYKKVQDVDNYLRSNPTWREWLFEVHPELSFRAWNNNFPIPVSKKSKEGMRIRKQLIAHRYSSGIFHKIRGQYPQSVVANDDIADAFAALWTAVRIYTGVAIFIPAPPEVDSFGLCMAIVY